MPEPTTITVSPASATLQSLGEAVRLAATVEDQDGETMPNVTITWTSRDTRAATVDGNGLVTAAARPRATDRGGRGRSGVEVTVAQRPAEVAVSPLLDTLVALDRCGWRPAPLREYPGVSDGVRRQWAT